MQLTRDCSMTQTQCLPVTSDLLIILTSV